jgi:hypothetical protein
MSKWGNNGDVINADVEGRISEKLPDHLDSFGSFHLIVVRHGIRETIMLRIETKERNGKLDKLMKMIDAHKPEGAAEVVASEVPSQRCEDRHKISTHCLKDQERIHEEAMNRRTVQRKAEG